MPEKINVSTETLHENVDWTLYDGLEVKGWPVVAISRGAVLVENGEFHGKPGRVDLWNVGSIYRFNSSSSCSSLTTFCAAARAW